MRHEFSPGGVRTTYIPVYHERLTEIRRIYSYDEEGREWWEDIEILIRPEMRVEQTVRTKKFGNTIMYKGTALKGNV